MSAPSNKKSARDLRPKVISFPTTLHGLNIAASQSILWPCHAFSISIPQKKKSALNIFEQTVLKLSEIESGDSEKIALLTCLEKELVAFIQNRLNQLGLLNSRNELSEDGKKLLESWRDKSEANLEYVAGTVFVDLHTGKLLPFVHVGNLQHEKISAIDGPTITINLGSTGKSKSIHCRLIHPSSESFWQIVPKPDDIVRTLREFKRRYKRYALLNRGTDHYPPPVPMAEAVSVNDSPELVYLHCEAFIQTGSSEVLVTDGGGFGFSESFANYITRQSFEWIIMLKQQGVIDSYPGDSDNQTSRKSFKYAEISKRIVGSKSALQRVKNLEVNSTYYESNYRQEIENGIKNLYAALEWSLRQVVADNLVSEWEQVFSARNFRDNQKLLVSFAEKIGFVVNEKNHKLLQVKPGAIRQIDKGKVELQPLLALALAGANSNSTHPMHRLAKNHSGFLNHVLRLKKYRDPIEHGSTESLDIDEAVMEEMIESTVPLIISLMPDVGEDLGEGANCSIDKDINQDRLKAIISLERALGVAFLSSLSNDIKEQLIRSELMFMQLANGKVIEVIKCYASVIQHALLDAVSDRIIEEESELIRESAVGKIIQVGYFTSEEQVPLQLTTVSAYNIKRAVQGSSATLGAHLLALFLLGSESELNELKKSDSTFVDFIADLIRLRGHGNIELSDFSLDDMESLKINVFKSIKIIKEVF